MLKKVILPTLLLVLLGLAHTDNDVFASQPCAINATWLSTVGTPQYVTFTEKQHGASTFIPLSRADNTNIAPSGFVTNGFWEIAETFTTTWDCTPRSAHFTWKRENVNSGSGRIETSDDGITWTTRASGSISVNTSAAFVQTITWTNSTDITYKYIRMVAGSSAPRILKMYIDADDALPIMIKPLLSSDQSSITTSGDATVATANTPFLPVHAPANATVTSITPLDSDDCTGLGVSSVTCATVVQAGSHKVVMTVDGNTYIYIVADAPTYVDLGGITAGCIMGQSTQVSGIVITDIPIDYLVTEPDSEAESCKETPPPPEDCLNDDLTNASAWYKSGAVTWGDEVVLGAGGRIYQVMSLPTNTQSRLIVTAKSGRAELIIGTSRQVYNLPDEYSNAQIGFDIHEPNLVDFTEISIKNTGDTDLYIGAVCVELDDGDGDGGEDYTIPDNDCYFRNFGFSDALEHWSITGGAQDGTGQVLIPDGGGISQPVALFAGEWALSLDIGLIYDDDFDLSANASEAVVISYVFPLDDPPAYVDFPSLTIGDISDNQNFRVSVNFTIATDDEGDFYIEIDIPTLAGLDGVSISRACLRPADGDWGENPPPDDGVPFTETCDTISPPRGNNISSWVSWHWFNLSQFFECDLMVTLNNTYGLLRWFQAMFMLFFNWLGDMGTWVNGHVQNLITAIAHSGSANSSNILSWQMPTDVTGINFSEISGIMTDSPQSFESEECRWYDVFCHGRNIAGGVVDFAGGVLSDVASVLVNFIGALLAQIVDWITMGYRTYIEPIVNLWNDFWEIIGQVRDAIVYIIQGENTLMQMWNDTEPIAPPGLQDCSIQPETKTLCLVYWVIDNTLLSGDWGGLIIPMLSSILGILGLLLIIDNFMALIRTAKDA